MRAQVSTPPGLADILQRLAAADAEVVRLRAEAAPILVTDRLPEHMALVIIHAPGTARPVWFGQYDADFDMWIGEGDIYYRDGQVVAWQPLPPALPAPEHPVREPEQW